MTQNNPQFLEKPLPSAPEAEKVILGAIQLDNELIAQAAETLIADDFYSPAYKRIFRAMLDLFEQGKRIDPILIGEELRKEGQLENIGGISAITNLTYGLPHFSNIEAYVKAVKEKSTARKIIRTCNEITGIALEEDCSVEELSELAEQMIYNASDRNEPTRPESIFAVGQEVFADITEKLNQGKNFAGISSGFIDVDRKIGGWKKGDLIYLAARPSMGKTSIALQFAYNAAIEHHAAFFSLEMTKPQLWTRLVCSEASVDVSRVINGEISAEEHRKIGQANADLYHRNLTIDDQPAISTAQLRGKLKRIKQSQKRLDLVVIDYLGLMAGKRQSGDNRQQEVSQISRELKAIAKEMNVPVIALSQLSRAPEVRNPPRPIMSDLRDSGSLEQDADIVMFLYRDEYYKPTDQNAGIAELIIAKNRQGATGTADLSFTPEFTRFDNLSRQTSNYQNYYERG